MAMHMYFACVKVTSEATFFLSKVTVCITHALKVKVTVHFSFALLPRSVHLSSCHNSKSTTCINTTLTTLPTQPSFLYLNNTMSFVKSFLFATALFSAPPTAHSQLLANWDVNFLSMETDFSVTGTDELILHYEIGKDRVYDIALFDRGCVNPIEGIAVTYADTKTPKDGLHDQLDIALDVERPNIATSNLWNSFTNKFELCLRLQLLSGDMVIKEDAREISIQFDFQVDFTADAVVLGSVMKSSGVGSTTVDSYVEACKCTSIDTFECNSDMLSPNQELYLCVRSTSPDIEVDSLHSLIITQGPETVLIIDGNTVQDESISAKYVVPEHNGVAVAMLVPAAFWNYGGMSQVSLTGTVYLKLVNSRRLGAVELSIPSSFDDLRLLRSEAQSFDDNAEEVGSVEDEDEDESVDKSSFQVSVGLAELESDDTSAASPSSSICMPFVIGALISVAQLVL